MRSGLPGWRQLFLPAAILAVGCFFVYFRAATSPSNRPTSSLVTPTTGSVVAEGVEGSNREAARSTYASKCASCHGVGGNGDGWQAWLLRLQMRDLTDEAYMRTLPDEYLFQIIKQGGASLGKPGMPSWGQELNDREINSLVRYIRGLALP